VDNYVKPHGLYHLSRWVAIEGESVGGAVRHAVEHTLSSELLDAIAQGAGITLAF